MALVIGQFKLGNLWRSQSEILTLIISHIHRYPAIEARDAYKILFQGCMGIKHYISDPGMFEKELVKEFDNLNPGEIIPLWENLRPDGEIVRLNLAAYKSRGGELDGLSTLCLWTASSFKGSLQNLKESWETFMRICRDGRLRKFDAQDLAGFNDWVMQRQYPAVHHSERYREAYHPAYRIIRREFLNLLAISKK